MHPGKAYLNEGHVNDCIPALCLYCAYMMEDAHLCTRRDSGHRSSFTCRIMRLPLGGSYVSLCQTYDIAAACSNWKCFQI
eukprot:363954-Chlamydomonas_euryale.AAC.1